MATKPVTLTDNILLTLQWHAAAVAMLTLIAGAAIYVLWRPRGGMPRVLLGPQRWWAVPWQLPEVLLATLVLLYLVGLVVDVLPFLHKKLDPNAFAGFQVSETFAVLVGPNDSGLAAGLTSFVGTLWAYPEEKIRRVSETRTLMLAQLILFPFLIYLVVDMMRRLVNARAYQMGLHLHRWRENVTLGCIGWLLAMPVVVLVFLAVKLEFWETLWGRPTEHPISRLITMDHAFATWLLAALTTVIVAPLNEEFLLRGVIQPYLVRWPVASDLLILFSIGVAVLSLFTPGTASASGQGMGPLLYVIFAAAGYYWFERATSRWLPEPGAARGIFATSLIFATLHGAAWPSPIPLFVLSVILGVLAYRTGSLVGPITLHALFNATAMLVKYMETQAGW